MRGVVLNLVAEAMCSRPRLDGIEMDGEACDGSDAGL